MPNDYYNTSDDIEGGLWDAYDSGRGLSPEDLRLMTYIEQQRGHDRLIAFQNLLNTPSSAAAQTPDEFSPAPAGLPPMQQASYEGDIPTQAGPAVAPTPIADQVRNSSPEPLRYSLGAFGLDPTIANPEAPMRAQAPPIISAETQAGWQEIKDNPLVFEPSLRRYIRANADPEAERVLQETQATAARLAASGDRQAQIALPGVVGMGVHAQLGQEARSMAATLPSFANNPVVAGYAAGREFARNAPPPYQERRLQFDIQRQKLLEQDRAERLKLAQDREVQLTESRRRDAVNDQLRQINRDITELTKDATYQLWQAGPTDKGWAKRSAEDKAKWNRLKTLEKQRDDLERQLKGTSTGTGKVRVVSISPAP